MLLNSVGCNWKEMKYYWLQYIILKKRLKFDKTHVHMHMQQEDINETEMFPVSIQVYPIFLQSFLY